jgi:hypothetical protein
VAALALTYPTGVGAAGLPAAVSRAAHGLSRRLGGRAS